MSLNLCIDWGNTNVKAALFAGDRIEKQIVFSEDAAVEQVTQLLEAYQPVKAILCSVVSNSDEVAALLRSKLPHTLLMTGHTNVPINNAYLSADTLGPDRLALVNAAHFEFPDKNNLVISVGTCITYNLVQKNKTFRGGAISPGMHMRLKAMSTFTDRLPEITAVDDEPLLLGYDTETCLQSGAVNGMAAEIDGMIKAYEERYPDFNAILTGGDAPYFATKLKSKIFADPNMLLKGLNLILNHNVSSPR
jgi:type III pantothenate kinase